VPELTISTAKIFGAVDSARVAVVIPADTLDGVRVTEGAWTFDFHRQGTKPIAIALELHGGKVKADASRITFDPALVIKTVGRGSDRIRTSPSAALPSGMRATARVASTSTSTSSTWGSRSSTSSPATTPKSSSKT